MKHLIYALALLTVLTVYSCASPRHTTQLVRDIQRDTIYMTTQQYDSIYIYQERSTDFKPSSLSREGWGGSDTVYIKDVSVEYKYRLLQDTVKIVQKDSIPYEVSVVKTKEITRPLTWYDHLTRAIFWLLCGVLFVQFVRLVGILKKRVF